MFMGPRAFVYYVPAAVRFLLGEEADGHSDAVSSFAMLLESRLEGDADAIADAFSALREAVAGILRDFGRFGCEEWAYGDVAARYRALHTRLDAVPRTSSRGRKRGR